MSERIATRSRSGRTGKACRHHWLIETPHGVTSRGVCKRCGATRRYPNAAEDALDAKGPARLGRWSRSKEQNKPAKIRLDDRADGEGY